MSERPSRTTAWISGLLLLSVALNCLLVGVVAGRWLMPGEETAEPAPVGRPLTFGERMRMLPQAERSKFHAAMAPYRPGIRAARAEVAAARVQFREALRREPYDAAATLAAMAAVRDKTALVQQRIQEAAAQAFAVLSPQSRQLLSRPYPQGR
jgi:uncharacterized membrane protein